MLFSNHAAPPNLKGLVGRIAPRPALFIYGEHDQGNVQQLAPVYYAAAGQPKAMWKVAGASHTGGIAVHPLQYEQRIIAFFLLRRPQLRVRAVTEGSHVAPLGLAPRRSL
jgi:pimeloyl-ACP methyl ester carboxylesterase